MSRTQPGGRRISGLSALHLPSNSGLALRTLLRRTADLTTPIIEQVAVRRSHYMVHAAVATIGLATLGVVAAQPRPVAPSAMALRAPTEEPADAMDTVNTANAVEESAPAPAEAPPAAVVPATVAPEPTPAPQPPKPVHHTVEEGENLRMLAARFGVSPETILAANDIQDADLLQVGQDLLILPTDGALHALKDGESLNSVAERYGVGVQDLLAANDLGGNPDVVQPGTELVVPGVDPMVDPYAATAATGDVQAANSTDQQAASTGPAGALHAHPVPSTRTYEVQPGDTLRSIAYTFGVDVDTILSSNGIEDPDTIKPGVNLRILPVRGVEYTVQENETLADIAWRYQIDLGVLLDSNELDNPDVIHVGGKIIVPGGKPRALPPAAVAAPAPAPAPAAPAAAASVAKPSASTRPAAVAEAAKPAAAAAAPKPKPAPAAPAPVAAAAPSGGGGGDSIVSTAMRYVGSRYVFGGTSPSGFDCSGFVYFVLNNSGQPVGRGMWQQYNGGSHVSISELRPGDVVFFANTYMPGLSHDGIYIGGGQFVHASDERTGVTTSNINSSYWAGHYVGAARY